MDNNPQNTPQPQFNTTEPVTPTEAVPVAPPEPVTPPTFPTEPAPTQAPNKSKKKLIIILIIIAILLIGGGVAGVFLLTPKKTSTKTAISTNKTNATIAPATKAIPYPGYEHKLDSAYNFDVNVPKGSRIVPNVYYKTVTCIQPSKNKSHGIPIIIGHDGQKINYSNITEYLINDHYGNNLWNPIDSNDLLRIEAEQTEQKTINGIDVKRFVGKSFFENANNKQEFSGYTIGYLFSIDDIPYIIIGFNVDPEDQNQEDVDKLTTAIDGIANTIRKKE